MNEPIILWDLEDDLEGNYVHIVVDNGVTQDEVAEILQNPNNDTTDNRSSGRPITFGWTSSGKYLAVVWEHADDDPWAVIPVTAYPTNPPKGRKR